MLARRLMPRRPPTRDAASATDGKRGATTDAAPPAAKKGKTTLAPLSPRAVAPARPPRTHSAAVLARAERIAEFLERLYPHPECPLRHDNPVQLLIAVLLSAQTTDVKVNEATVSLFAAAPDAPSLASLGAAGVEPHIKTLGLAPTKSRNVAATAELLVSKHGGSVPLDFAALQALPGVGRKTASVILAMAGPGQLAFPVDTHIHRLAARWGLSTGANVEQTEADLMAAFSSPRHDWGQLHLRMIYYGREHCPARGHDDGTCEVCGQVKAERKGGKGGGVKNEEENA